MTAATTASDGTGAAFATPGTTSFGAATPFTCGSGATPASSRGGSKTPSSALACRLEGTPGPGGAGEWVGVIWFGVWVSGCVLSVCECVGVFRCVQQKPPKQLSSPNTTTITAPTSNAHALNTGPAAAVEMVLGVTTQQGGEAARFAAKMAEKFPFLHPKRCAMWWTVVGTGL